MNKRQREDAGKSYVVIQGTFGGGFTVHGPFEVESDAFMWGEQQPNDYNFWVTSLEPIEHTPSSPFPEHHNNCSTVIVEGTPLEEQGFIVHGPVPNDFNWVDWCDDHCKTEYYWRETMHKVEKEDPLEMHSHSHSITKRQKE